MRGRLETRTPLIRRRLRHRCTFAGFAALLLGATAIPGLWAVALVFGLFWAAFTALNALSRPHRIALSGPIPAASPMKLSTIMKRPSALLPLAMSFAAFLMVLVTVSVIGVVRNADEGTAAHVFQLLMAVQVPIVACFAVKWVPRAPKQAMFVLAMHGGAALGALAPVFTFGL